MKKAIVLWVGLVLALCMWLGPRTYEKTIKEDLDTKGYSFLAAGEYALDISYKNDKEGNRLIGQTLMTTNAENQLGITYLDEKLPLGEGILHTTLTLTERTQNLILYTSLEKEAEEIQGESAGPILTEATIRTLYPYTTDHICMAVICLAATLVILGAFWQELGGRKALSREKAGIALVIGMGLAASIPLMNNFLPYGHDLEFHISRMEGIYEAMREGQFPVYINPVQLEGYGSITTIMYPYLFLLPAVGLRFLGVSGMLAYKLTLAAIHIGTGLIAFYSFKRMTASDKIGLWGAALYTFSLYRLIDTYSRASLGELLAMMFMPMVMAGIYEILWGDEKRFYLLMLGMCGMLQSHVLSVEMTLLFLVLETIFWLVFAGKKGMIKRIGAGSGAAMGTLLLNAFYLVPFLKYSGEKLQAFQVEVVLSETAAYFSQMFDGFSHAVGQNLNAPTTQAEMPISMGLVIPLGVVLLLVGAYWTGACDRNEAPSPKEASLLKEAGSPKGAALTRMAWHGVILGGLAVLAASWLFPWDYIQDVEWANQIFSPLQFTWRFLGPASALLSLPAAIGICSWEGKGYSYIRGCMAFFLIATTAFYMGSVSKEMEARGDKMELMGLDVTDSLYLYEDASFHYFTRDKALMYAWGGSRIQCENYERKAQTLGADVSVVEYKPEDYLVFPIYDYPGYELRIDGKVTEIVRKDTLIACEMPKGDCHVEIRYVGFPEFKWANLLSCVSVSALLVVYAGIWVIRKWKRTKVTG